MDISKPLLQSIVLLQRVVCRERICPGSYVVLGMGVRWHSGHPPRLRAVRLHKGHEIAHENVLQQGKLEADGAVDLAMLHQLLRELEHTRGVDVKK